MKKTIHGQNMAYLIDQYGWHEWLCKTNFSFLIGASHPHEMVTQAVEYSYNSLCINDFDGVYGIARTYLEARKQPLKIHYGCEIHLEQDHQQPVLAQNTLALNVRSHVGYRNMCQIISHCHRDGKKQAFIDLDELAKFDLTDIFAIQPQRGFVRTHSFDQCQQHYAKIKELFAKNYYLALSYHHHPAEDIWIKKTLMLGELLEIPHLLTQDAFFHDCSQKPLSDILHTIRCNKPIDENSANFFPNSERGLHSLQHLDKRFQRFSNYKNYLINSCELAESCQFQLDELHYQYPKEMIPEGHNAQSFLAKTVWQFSKDRFEIIPDEIVRRLTDELQLVEKLNFADYFLTVWDIVTWARSQNILCQGRGSAANSTICFVLGITSVDPDKFDLLFERFVSLERGDPPDIDVDFEHERREEVIQYIYRRYGRKRAAMVANVITYQSKGALRSVGKAFGVPDIVLNKISRKVRTKYFRGKGIAEVLKSVRQDILQDEDFALLLPENLSWDLWAELSNRIKGFPRHLGIHSGGFIIAEKHLDELVPQEPATMPDRTVVQWCKEDIEGLNFFKIDILALGMLTAMRKAFIMVEKNYGKRLRLCEIEHDIKTYQMIQRADTVGTFQIESRAQMSMLPRLKPETFYDLVIEIAIIRPGPIQGGVIHPFLKRRERKEPITYPHEKLRPILEKTHGIVIFQEQAMRVAMSVGDFTAGEANELRKNIGTWNISGFEKKLGPWLKKLESGLKKNGIDGEFKDQIMGQLRGFSSYGFPESHALSFALIAYASCYLKCHYPAAFFASVLNSQPMGFYSPHALLQTAQRDGVSVLPLCLNNSHWDNTLEKEQDKWAIRLGFRLVNSLSSEAITQLINERQEHGDYQDYESFILRSRIYRNDLTALAATDIFAKFGLLRSEAIWRSEAAPLKPLIDVPDSKVDWKADSRLQVAQRDFAAFRTTLWDHPVKIIKQEHWNYKTSLTKLRTSSEFKKIPRNHMIDTFGMILVKQAPGSAKGMVFISLEDEFGFINLVFSPQTYERYYKLIDEQSYLCVHGRMQKSGEGHSLLVKWVYPQIQKTQTLISLKPQNKTAEEERQIAFKELQRPRSYM